MLQYINGQYAFQATGFDSSGAPLTAAGSLTADGSGHITDGVIDVNDNLSTTETTPITGTYTFDTNGRGTFVIANALQAFSNSPTFSFTIDLTTNSGTIAAVDNSLPAVSGTIDKQTAAAFATTPSGAFIMRATSDNPDRAGLVGRFNVVGGGSMSNGFGDLSDVVGGNDAEDASLTGLFSISDAHGRGTNNTFNIAGVGGSQLVYYGITSTKYYLFETGNSTTGSQSQFVGVMRAQGSLTSSSASGSSIFGLVGGDFVQNGAGNFVYGSVTNGNMVLTSGTSASVNYDLNDASLVSTSAGGSPVTGTVDFDPTTGRGTIAFSGGFNAGFIDSAVFYLEATNKGVMMDTTAFSGNAYPESLVGDFVPQGSTTTISGNVQGVDLVGDAGTPATTTAALFSGGSISGLQDGAIPGSGIGTDEALGGTFSSVSSTGRSTVTLNSQFLAFDGFTATAYAIDATHFYLIQTEGSTQDANGYTSSLGIYSTQALPAVPTGVRAAAKTKMTGQIKTNAKKMPDGKNGHRTDAQRADAATAAAHKLHR